MYDHKHFKMHSPHSFNTNEEPWTVDGVLYLIEFRFWMKYFIDYFGEVYCCFFSCVQLCLLDQLNNRPYNVIVSWIYNCVVIKRYNTMKNCFPALLWLRPPCCFSAQMGKNQLSVSGESHSCNLAKPNEGKRSNVSVAVPENKHCRTFGKMISNATQGL